MAPNTEQLILSELRAIRSEQSKQGQDIAALKSTIASDRRFCGDCKAAINKDVDNLFDRMRKVELKEAQQDGKEAEQDISAKENQFNLTTIIALIAAAGAWAAVFIK